MERSNRNESGCSDQKPDTVFKEIEGDYGKIRILTVSRAAPATHEELHTLIASILYKNSKRTASVDSDG